MGKKSTKKMSKTQSELIDKWIIVLLGLNDYAPIKGRIRFIKDFFLFSRKYLSKLFEISQFFPYHFGPYSTRVAQRINILKKNSDIIEAVFENNDWKYSLSEKGKNIFQKISKDIDIETLKRISTIKQRFQESSIKNILKEIYVDYPEYAKRSIMKDIVKERVNLADLEKIDDSGCVLCSAIDESDKIVLDTDAAKKILQIISE